MLALIFTASMIDSGAKMSPFTAVSLLLTLALQVITMIKFRMDQKTFQAAQKKSAREEERNLEELISRVCRSFTESDSYRLRREQEMIAVAVATTDEAFRVRSSSFVDAEAHRERRAAVDARMARIEKSLEEVRKDFTEAATRIATTVSVELRSELREIMGRA